MYIALLGRRDSPTDGIEDYCEFLGNALKSRGAEFTIARIDWPRVGWRSALAQLKRESRDWRDHWVLVQYTALAFSSRGFPFRALEVLRILRGNGARCAVVFHDPIRQGGRRFRDRLRGEIQEWVIRRIFGLSEAGIFLDPFDKIAWLTPGNPKAFYIPIGANIPEPSQVLHSKVQSAKRTVAVFCLSLGAVGTEELGDIFEASRAACEGGASFRLIFLGRGTEESRNAIADTFRGTSMEISVVGIVKPERVAEILADSDAMLCVRGMLYSRRGSAIAGIACGLPILGYAGAAEGTPIAEAGVMLVGYRNAGALGQALAHVLTESGVAEDLRNRSISAYKKYFSWDLIADAFLRSLGDRRS